MLLLYPFLTCLPLARSPPKSSKNETIFFIRKDTNSWGPHFNTPLRQFQLLLEPIPSSFVDIRKFLGPLLVKSLLYILGWISEVPLFALFAAEIPNFSKILLFFQLNPKSQLLGQPWTAPNTTSIVHLAFWRTGDVLWQMRPLPGVEGLFDGYLRRWCRWWIWYMMVPGWYPSRWRPSIL